MKKLTIIVILVAAILLLVPPVLGIQAQSRLDENIARTMQQSGGYFDVSLDQYERGWFSSTGTINFRFSDAYLEANPMFAQVADENGASVADMVSALMSQELTVSHGPVLMGQQTGLGLGQVITVLDGSSNPELGKILARTSNDYFLRSSLIIGFTGMGDFSVEAPPFKLTDPTTQQDTVVFAGANATGTMDLSDLHMIVSGQMNGFSFVSDQGEAVVERTTFSADMAYPESDPYGLGRGEINLDRMVALSDDQTAVDIRQASIAFTSDKNDDGQVSLSMTYAIDKFTTADAGFSDMKIGFSMANLDSATLVRMQEIGNQMSTDPLEDPEQLLALYIDPAYDLLAGGASMQFDPVRFTYNEQPFIAAVKLQTKPANLPEKSTFSFDNPPQLLSLFSVNADLSIDQALALELAVPQLKQQLAAGVPEGTEINDTQLEEMARAQAPMMMGALVGQGFLQEQGSNYTTTAVFDNGTLVVNGKDIPLGALLGAAGG